MKKVLFGAAALACLLSVACGSPAPQSRGEGAPAASIPSADCWSRIPSPNRDPALLHNRLLAVALVDDDDAWAVGDSYEASEGGIQRPLILHWDGSEWAIVPHPADEDEAGSLTDIAASAPDEAWAVGSTSEGALVEHWDGAAWTSVPVEDPGTPYWHFNSVTALPSGDVWIAGVAATGQESYGLVERWEGRQWRIVLRQVIEPRPLVGLPYGILDGITASSSDDVWAVGEATNVSPAGPSNTLTAHFDGHSWGVVESPDVEAGGAPFDHLFDVSAVAPDDVWAVGSYGDRPGTGGGGDRGLIEHFDGTEWSVAEVPDLHGDHRLSAVATLSSGQVVAVGSNGVSDSFRPLVLGWDGDRWASATPAGMDWGWLTGVAGSPDGSIWAVGSTSHDDRTETLVLRCDSGT